MSTRLPYLLRWFGSGLESRLVAYLVALALALMVATTAYVSHRALNSFQDEIMPAYDREAYVVGRSVVLHLTRAIDLGIEPSEFVGVQEFFEPIRQANPTFNYMVLADENGKELVASGTRIDLFRRALADGRIRLTATGTSLAPIDGRAQANAGTVTSLGNLANTAVPIVAGGQLRGWLNIGVDRSEIGVISAATRWDILIVLLVSTLTAVELLGFLVERSLKAPLRIVQQITQRVEHGDWTHRVETTTRDELGRLLLAINAVIRRVNDHWVQFVWKAQEVRRVQPDLANKIDYVLGRFGSGFRFAEGSLGVIRDVASPINARVPLFIFVFAEQLSTSFMPLFAKQVLTPLPGLGESVVIGLPIVVFVAVLALVTPYGGALVSRYGARHVFLIGAVPAVVGYALVATASSIPELMLWRALNGAGYAFITIACQGYLAESATPERRARIMANFVFAVMTGAVCGTAIGAVVADRIGFRGTFLCSAFLVLLAAMFVWRNMDTEIGRRSGEVPVKLRDAWPLLFNRRFMGLVVFAAIPAKVVLYGFIFYLVPLYLASLDLNQPLIGRIMMTYGLTMLLTIYLGAQLSDRLGIASQEIVWCGVVTGLGMLAVIVVPAPATAVLIAIILVGLCQGLSSAPLLTVVPALCPEECDKLGQATLFSVIRFAERIGSVLGPIVAALLVTAFGFETAILAIGALSAVTALFFAALSWRDSPKLQRSAA
jgi:predicted MFS family arabinose efflux permease/HAMP domain-containing protein